MSSGALTPTEFSTAVTALTSAFGDPTRREIYLFAHSVPTGVTASEVAEKFELHPNVARHHLDKLAGGGYLTVEVAKPAGGAGRPSKRYCGPEDASAGVDFELPIRSDELLVTLLGRALALLPEEQAREMAEQVGAEYGRAIAAALGPSAPRSLKAALHTVADALSSHGFASHTNEVPDNGLRLVSEHCPFGDVPHQHPVICAVDRGMVTGMLSALYGKTSADVETSLPRGDDVCVTIIGSS